MIIKRRDILLARLDPIKGSEQGKTRPCLVVQNDIANKFSPNTIIIPLTSRIPDKDYPTTVIVEPEESGLAHTSAALCSQIRAISVKHRVIRKLGMLKPEAMKRVEEGIKASLAIE